MKTGWKHRWGLLLLGLCLSLFSMTSFAADSFKYLFKDSTEVISYQKNKELEVQELLNKIYGEERVLINLKVRITEQEQISGALDNVILPGVPNTQLVRPKISKQLELASYVVSLWIDPTIPDQQPVLELVQTALDFGIYTESTINVSVAIERQEKPLIDPQLIQETSQIMKSIFTGNTLNIAIRVPEINDVLTTAISSNSQFAAALNNKLDTGSLIFILAGVFLLMIIGIVLALVLRGGKGGGAGGGGGGGRGGKGDGDGGSGGGGGGGGAAGGAAAAGPAVAGAVAPAIAGAAATGGPAGGALDVDVEHHQASDDELDFEKHKKREFFHFIEESNIFKLAFILQQEKPKGGKHGIDEYWQKVAIIVSFLPSHLSRIIFMKYNIDEQSEIIPYLAYEVDYPMAQIEELEKEFQEKLDNLVLVGGKMSVMPILDKFSNQKKSELAMALNAKHPDVLTEIRDMIILFEDLMGLHKEELTKLLMEVDPNILALTLIDFEEGKRSEIIAGLAEGLQDMIKEVIELRKDNYTEVEVQDARDTMIQIAKTLNRSGVIKLQLEGFGAQEETINQEEIDKLFKGD